MKLYNTISGCVLERDGRHFQCPMGIDELLARPGMEAQLAALNSGSEIAAPTREDLIAPIGTQEVWASGVTYFRSRDARMEESKSQGGSDFYERVYSAERPELFFKANGPRVVAPGGPVRIRRDAQWSVPEPELTLVINRAGAIIGYTVGNDMSSRDIEGENPLYLPQAKVYDGSCSLGPCILLQPEPLAKSTAIRIEITRSGSVAFRGETSLSEMKRTPEELGQYLFRENSFPVGAFLLTGTGIVPPDAFTLQSADRIRIEIEAIGILENTVH